MTKLVLAILIATLNSTTGFAGTLTIRDLKLNVNNQLEIALDGAPSKASLDMEFVRDVVQFSIQNATIYPAKILHSDGSTQAFTKVFAYQYSPSLVRVRFSVDGKADQFQGKVKWELKGKTLIVSFPAGAVASINDDGSAHEKSLLAKVLGRSDDVKVEKIADPAVKAPSAESVKAEAKAEARAEAKAEAQKEVQGESKREHRLTGSPNSVPAPALGGAKPAVSGLRSFLSMLLVVGGLGLVLVYVKKKKNGAQAKKVGNSWFSNLLHHPKKQKSLIEVVGVHALGPKQSITVVRIRGQQLVLGVTEGNVQLITQLDSDEDIDVLDDPKIADSLGKIFGAQPTVTPMPNASMARAVAQQVRPNHAPQADLGASFNAMLKSSTGAGAIVARNAYQAQGPAQGALDKVAARSVSTPTTGLQSSVRDQIKQRLQGMRN